MLRALSKSNVVVAALAQRQVATVTRVQAVAAFHSSSSFRNSNDISDIFASLRSNSSSNPNSNSSSSASGTTTSSLFGSRSTGPRVGGRSDMSLFGSTAAKANTTSNPIHLDTNHPTEGRSFKVNSPAMIDQTYRRLRTTLNQSNMKRELRLKRTYENGHTRMRRENQERNKKLFGAMVRKKIELIKLMKIRGM
ncbi:hypothetical protein EDD21DRAFT_402396 [Dissophora ornata]|nr:hypothetical protein BGZ58_007402 [Dissophora ornata]KAI8603994.1 hypothetical protein EDD21DRAFT_402396 [Dissophora ornata]